MVIWNSKKGIFIQLNPTYFKLMQKRFTFVIDTFPKKNLQIPRKLGFGQEFQIDITHYFGDMR